MPAITKKDPETIGKHFLEVLARFQTTGKQ
jgi:hypothetical protein